ncbi:MAG: hypothetical protein AVDCRST_MAG59-2110 [uncultured Thermomicrobiales bacterium]|uniref:Uncharacterized protein n=1 Tax=uncultured Thermomicrobiales bacterium TaxID=1645740 RepID=A0A6J4UQB9_9BACT|nr:MAG: hypothetical protein AVDCRST_MAG59-2110 [uncultured Thermomicrobiales bacterium]
MDTVQARSLAPTGSVRRTDERGANPGWTGAATDRSGRR